MIFESLWPLAFLVAVPIIIILYLLKPKGEDYRISSNLLWQKLLKNEQSRTFFEKFIHNILMYLQILIVALLVIALMSPFLKVDGVSGGRKILLIDTSGSMQHEDASGKSRLEEAVELACEYVQTAENTRFSIVTTDAAGVELLTVDSSDSGSLVRTLREISGSDCGGELTAAQGILDTLAGDGTDEAADLLVYTDGAGASVFEELHSAGDKELYVVGDVASNLANEYTVFTEREDGLFDVLVSVVNYSDSEASFDVGLYDGEEKLTALTKMQLESAESKTCLFEAVELKEETMTTRISGIIFENGNRDSLEADNVSRAVKQTGRRIHGLFIGEGNTFIEKAYQAVTGENIIKTSPENAFETFGVSGGMETADAYNVVIYDAVKEDGISKENVETPIYHGNRLIFGAAYGESAEVKKNVVLSVVDCDLTAGLSGFNIGVNTAYCFEVPEGAKSFLEYEGKCVGYYGERDGKKEVVVGFDIRESDFPLRAEFPIFLINAMIYLSDTSWLTSNVYYAGEEIVLQPWAEADAVAYENRPEKAGLYSIGNEEYEESYVVRFQTATESDGQAVAESSSEFGQMQKQKVKQTLRNLFLLLALALLLAEWIVYVRQMRYKGRFYAVVRGVVILLVFLALLGLQIRIGSNRTATVFLVDLSNSNENNMEALDGYLGKAVEQMPAGNSYGIVTFGKDAQVEQFITAEKSYAGMMTLPEKTATNFEEAISKALTLMPGDTNARLVMLTDGKETRGDITRMAQALMAAQVEFLTIVYETEETQDAYIDNVTLPTYLHPGDKYSIHVKVESNFDTDADILLYNESALIASGAVHLNKGSNQFVFSSQVSPEADSNVTENLRVQVKAQGDTCVENDFYSAYSVVQAAPKILVISGKNTNASGFTAVLNAAGCDYSVVSALNAPTDIQSMLDYKAILLVDTYIDDLPQGFLNHLETYVKDYGCGFVCCGGEDSFALGGYKDTVLETVLPVDMQLRSVNEMPSMAMVMVIDHSGSMTGSMDSAGASNLDVAIKAATVAVDNLNDSDYVGVLTFDDSYEWQVELTEADDKAAIKEEIKDISAGGGTTIKPALLEAYNEISQSDASIKHVILLTDGMGETTNYADVISAYSGSGITLSTVAVGEESDTRLLENLADNCGGRYYYSDLSGDIPKIFAQEVFLGGDSYIQNGEFALSVVTGHELTGGLFAEGWPIVYGYIASTPKTASSSIITTSEKEDPILTVWQYGLGRTVAWNSDVTGEWSGAFAGKEDYVALWKRIVDYSTGNADMGGDRVDVVTASERTEIIYEAQNYSADTQILATVIDPEGNTDEVKLHATAPGKFEAEVATPQTGMYHFNIRRTSDGEIQSYLTTAAAVQFSDEYKFDVSAAPYLAFAEKYGRIITENDDIWKELPVSAKGKRPLTNWLLGLAILLFLADVAMRRFQFVPRWNWKKRPVTDNATQLIVDNTAQPVADNEPDRTESGAGKTSVKKKKKKKQSGRAEQTLDTSQLLKKKDDRNM